jgi:hypothetical protein
LVSIETFVLPVHAPRAHHRRARGEAAVETLKPPSKSLHT